MTGTPLPQTTDLAACYVTDTHKPESPESHVNNVLIGLDHAFAQPVPPCVIVHFGDGNKDEFLRLLQQERPQWANVMYLQVPGNHDGNVPYGAPSGTTPADPFSDLIASMPDVFQGREYWLHNVKTLAGRATHVWIIGMNTNVPYTMDDGLQAYPEVNDPGDWYTPNPDHTGLTIDGSPQRQFLAEAFASIPSGSWIIPCGHRGIWTARHVDPRKNAVELRALYAEMEALGASEFPTGDVHTACVVRDPDGKATFLALDGGFFLREPQPEVVPDGWLRWVTPWTVPTSGMAHVAYQEFFGDSSALKIIEVSDAQQSPTIVYTETLNRNGGVAGSLEPQ